MKDEPLTPPTPCEPAMQAAERDYDAERIERAVGHVQLARTQLQQAANEILAEGERFYGVHHLIVCAQQATYRAVVHAQETLNRLNKASE